MVCERCNKRPATVHYTEITNSKKQEIHLCEECAREAGITGFGVMPQFVLHNLLGGLYEEQKAPVEPAYGRCLNCGLTEQEFAGRGLFGCADCYTSLRPAVDQILRRVHGTTQHIGKLPQRCGKLAGKKQELKRLRRELEAVVRKEEFEKAAEIRDRIRDLEKGLEGGK
ncbi:MAG: UvrB/UvrC motif-containing protein [Bacillota bacterium]